MRLRARRRRVNAGWAFGLAGAVVFCTISGCGKHLLPQRTWLLTEGDVARTLEISLEAPSADARRGALERLKDSRFVNHKTVLDACDVIARTDASPSVCCAAIAIVTESDRPKSIDTLLDLLTPPANNTVGTVDRVRLDAIRGLDTKIRQGLVPAEKLEAVVAKVSGLLHNDRSRDVRVAAARLLGGIASRESLVALIGGLNDADFGVVYHSEQSLMHLTGVTHRHDARAWQTWLGRSTDPFAMRGQIDDQLGSAPKPGWWTRMGRRVKSAFSWRKPTEQQ